MRTRLRWPVINGQASGALYLPDSLTHGKYTLLAGLQQRFFEVIGEIQDDRNSGSIQAYAPDQNRRVGAAGSTRGAGRHLTIGNWLFEDNALMAFSGTKNNDQPLNIRISTQLDSSYAPLAVAGRAFYIGNPPSAVRQTLNEPIETSEAAFADRGNVLPAVLVRTTAKTPAQQFNEKYVSSLFRSGDERMLSIMDDHSAFSAPNIFTYLQGRVAGLQ
jgi:hypothetical protein